PPTVPGTTTPAVVSAAELAQRLTRLDPRGSARTAAAAVLAAWGERPLGSEETRLPEDLEAVAWRRGLEELEFTANRSMLRLLPLPALPALLERRVGGASAPCWVSVTAMDDSRIVLGIDGASIATDAGLVEPLWTGRAHVLWRDFDALGPTLRPGVRGAAVAHLQELLRRSGTEGVEPTGTFDAGTTRAGQDFHRRHRPDADGVVGPLARIVLYAEAGGSYRRPALAIAAGAAS